jgi:biotin transport system substrate-specific component
MLLKKRLSVLQMTYIALGAVLIAACSWISIPATVPFTLQTFAVLLVCDLLGGRMGLISVLLYLALGAVGVPVFSNFGAGIGHLLGVTGGYILGFVLSALVMWAVQGLCPNKPAFRLLGMVLGLAACYAAGTAWFMAVYLRTKGDITLGAVLGLCVLPYLIPDALKIALAWLISGRLRSALHLLQENQK